MTLVDAGLLLEQDLGEEATQGPPVLPHSCCPAVSTGLGDFTVTPQNPHSRFPNKLNLPPKRAVVLVCSLNAIAESHGFLQITPVSCSHSFKLSSAY